MTIEFHKVATTKAELFKSNLNPLTHSFTEGITMMINTMATYCKGLTSPHLKARSSTQITLISLYTQLKPPQLNIYSKSSLTS